MSIFRLLVISYTVVIVGTILVEALLRYLNRLDKEEQEEKEKNKTD